MTRGLWLADFQQEFPISELRCSCSSGGGRTTLSTEVAASVALHCRKLGRDRTNALIAVGRPLSPAANLVTTRLSDYRHDPRVALVGPCVLSFRCQGRSQAESTARRAYGCGARGRTVQQSRQWLAIRLSKGDGSSRRRSSSTATGGNT